MVVQRTELVSGNFLTGSLTKTLKREDFDITVGAWEICLESVHLKLKTPKQFSGIVGFSTNLVKGHQYFEDLNNYELNGYRIVPTILAAGKIVAKNRAKLEVLSNRNHWTSFNNGNSTFTVHLVDPVTYKPILLDAQFYLVFHFRRVD